MLTAEQVARIATQHTTHYELWGGEVLCIVSVHMGIYGHWTAVIVIERCDAPFKTMVYDGFSSAGTGSNITMRPSKEDMRTWIAESINAISNTGGYSYPIREADPAELFMDDNLSFALEKD